MKKIVKIFFAITAALAVGGALFIGTRDPAPPMRTITKPVAHPMLGKNG